MGLSLGKAVVHYKIAESRMYEGKKKEKDEYKMKSKCLGRSWSHSAANCAVQTEEGNHILHIYLDLLLRAPAAPLHPSISPG